VALKPLLRKDFTSFPSATTILPGSSQSSQFFTVFSHWWNFIYADVPSYGEKPSWFTQTAYPLDARNAWGAYKNPTVLVGVCFGSKTSYFVADIDFRSIYHPVQSLSSYKHFIHTMEEAGFSRYTVVRSSERGGLHIYFTLPEEVSTPILAEAVHHLLTEKGLTIADGTLEVFPAPKSPEALYKAHRLPLQPGSYVVDPVTLEPRHESIELFLQEAAVDAKGQDFDAIRELLARKKRFHIPTRSFSTEGGRFRQDLLERMQEGWTAYGQTNQILWVIGAYGRIFLPLKDEALTAYIVTTAKVLPGYHEFCRHQHEIERRARDWMRFSMKYYYPYGEWMERDTKRWRQDWRYTALGIEILTDAKTPQEETHEDTMRRVRFVLEELKEEGRFPKEATARKRVIVEEMREKFGKGMSYETLYKEEYRALWHPSYDEPFAMLPDPWEEVLEVGGVLGPNLDGEREDATSPIRYMLFLPPGREAGEAEMPEECSGDEAKEICIKGATQSLRLKIKNYYTTSLTATTYNLPLSGNSGASASKIDKKNLSIAKTSHLPGTWCRVARGCTLLPSRALVLIDSLSHDGKTVTVITRRGVILSGIPPDVLE